MTYLQFRPRFSLRTLAVLVTLVCAYFAAWEVTKRYGVPTFDPRGTPMFKVTSPIPFVLAYEDTHGFGIGGIESDGGMMGASAMNGPPVTYYYLWLFGPKLKIPFQSK